MPDSLRVLIVEDNPADFRLMVHALRQGGFDPVCQRVDTEPAFSAMLDEHPDVILSDYNLPQFDALRALTLLRQRQWDIPFIIVSGSIGEDIAVGAMKQGAADFLLKDRMARLGPSVTLALEQKQLREGKRQADATLQKRARLDAMCADVGLALTRADTLRQMLQYCTESMVQHLGAAFARIWTLNEAESVLELQASAGLYTHIDGPHRRVPVGQFKIGLIALERKPHLTNDVCNDPRVGDRAWAQREGMISFAGYPLVLADRLVGVMAMFARHPLETVTLDAMSAVANQMALGIQRKQDEAHLAHLISSSPAVIFSLELKGEEVRLSWISDNIKKLFGYATQECLRPHWFEDCVHAEDMPTLSRRWPEVMRDGRHTSEFRFRHKNGNFRWVRDEIQLLSSKPGQPGECVGSWSDVTERKGAE
ncbi:MAG TPA: response regulator, partial [Gemmataceae bacterium]|nr:response regulator [Gemmataceae bacterium]